MVKIRTFFQTITADARRLRLAGAVASQVSLLGTLTASTREDATRVDARVRAVRLVVALLSAVEAGPATNRLAWAVGLNVALLSAVEAAPAASRLAWAVRPNVAVLSAVEAAPATSRLSRAVRLVVALLSAAEAASTTSRLVWAVRPVVAMLSTAEAAPATSRLAWAFPERVSLLPAAGRRGVVSTTLWSARCGATYWLHLRSPAALLSRPLEITDPGPDPGPELKFSPGTTAGDPQAAVTEQISRLQGQPTIEWERGNRKMGLVSAGLDTNGGIEGNTPLGSTVELSQDIANNDRQYCVFRNRAETSVGWRWGGVE